MRGGVLRVAPLAAVLAAASAAYGTARQLDDDLALGEDVVCGVWGAIWRRPAVHDATGARADAREAVARFCSGDPAIGSTPIATLEDLWEKVQLLRAASTP
ncbi:MAG TPA: hypothetical protein VMB81_26255 [Candidatus Sulfotelmatobacter sp.]|nr:hypothetical protein [Candidatus Sulfotelmatobacter sp.]